MGQYQYVLVMVVLFFLGGGGNVYSLLSNVDDLNVFAQKTLLYSFFFCVLAFGPCRLLHDIPL